VVEEIQLREYEQAVAHPTGPNPSLLGKYLDDPAIEEMLRGDPLRGKLRITENRHGLCLRATRWVGVVRLGSIRIRVHPKLPAGTLWPLMAYAMGLDEIHRWSRVQVQASGDFADLLAQALLAEAERLWRGGLHRSYEERSSWLTAPTGRPDLAVLAGAQPLTRAALPCRHHAFTTDVPLNRLVLAGLTLAGGLTRSSRLRAELHRVVQQWSMRCSPVLLEPGVLDEAERRMNRLTEHYRTALHLVRLIAAGTGLDSPEGEVQIPGFLWDMAAVFERFVARFLADHLPDLRVSGQVGLADLYSVRRAPPGFRAPRPRPDLVLHRGQRVEAVLDTKYADLWQQRPSREVLYQASVYALAWSGTSQHDVPAILLYPYEGSEPCDLELRLHVAGAARARRIILRAVDWVRASEILWNGASWQQRVALARRWVSVQKPGAPSPIRALQPEAVVASGTGCGPLEERSP